MRTKTLEKVYHLLETAIFIYMITALEILGNGNHLIWQNPPRSEGEGNCRENNGQHTINSNSAASYRDRCVRDLFRGEDKNEQYTHIDWITCCVAWHVGTHSANGT
jgi:hypothetical protein